VRGDLAAWALIGFGFAYAVWGLRRAWKNKPHAHAHLHPGDIRHEHAHTHNAEHAHPHAHEADPVQAPGARNQFTPWLLFTIFVLGPCEPLIPLVMYPAAAHDLMGVVLVSAVFALCTVGTMLAVVLASLWGLEFVSLSRLDRYAHALAGGAICASGLAIRFLGL
jgi:ABC-type nickel/cobalt efflux system permease component RcnA